MNYYEHHLGDYMRDTAHLSFLEDAAYRRLLDAYYIREAPIPVDLREACRLVRAASKHERDAVAQVLREFFAHTPEGWRHGRCDREIERFKDKQRKASASANARWSKPQTHTERNAHASPNAMRTHSEGNALQTPDTSNQEIQHAQSLGAPPPLRAPDPPDPAEDGHKPTPAGSVCRAMRAAGLQQTNPGDPRLLELLRQGATEAEFVGLAAEAVAKGKSWPWVLVTLTARRGEAAAIALAPKPEDKAGKQAAEETARLLAEQRAKPKTAAPAHVRELLAMRKGAAA